MDAFNIFDYSTIALVVSIAACIVSGVCGIRRQSRSALWFSVSLLVPTAYFLARQPLLSFGLHSWLNLAGAWISLVVSPVVAIVGIWRRSSPLLLISTVLAVPLSALILISPTLDILGTLPLLHLASALLIRIRMRWAPWSLGILICVFEGLFLLDATGVVALSPHRIPISPVATGPTPEEAVYASVAKVIPDCLNTRIETRREWARGWVLVYTCNKPPSDKFPFSHVIGYSLVEPTASREWRVTNGSWVPYSAPLPAEVRSNSPVSYASSGGGGESGEFTIRYGRVLTSDAAVVEGVFSTGDTLQDRPTDKWFVLITPSRAVVCSMRVLDASMKPTWSSLPPPPPVAEQCTGR